jgi:hypothetical protein
MSPPMGRICGSVRRTRTRPETGSHHPGPGIGFCDCPRLHERRSWKPRRSRRQPRADLTPLCTGSRRTKRGSQRRLKRTRRRSRRRLASVRAVDCRNPHLATPTPLRYVGLLGLCAFHGAGPGYGRCSSLRPEIGLAAYSPQTGAGVMKTYIRRCRRNVEGCDKRRAPCQARCPIRVAGPSARRAAWTRPPGSGPPLRWRRPPGSRYRFTVKLLALLLPPLVVTLT